MADFEGVAEAVFTGTENATKDRMRTAVRCKRVVISDRTSRHVGYVLDYCPEVIVERSTLTDYTGVYLHPQRLPFRKLHIIDSTIGPGRDKDLVHPPTGKYKLDLLIQRSSISGLSQGNHRDLIEIASDSDDALYEDATMLDGRLIVMPDTDADWRSLDGRHLRTVMRRVRADEVRLFNSPELLIEGGTLRGEVGAAGEPSGFNVLDLRACYGDDDDRAHATTATIHGERIGRLELGGMAGERAPLQGVVISEDSGGCEVGEIVGRDASPEIRRRLTRVMVPVPTPIPDEPEPQPVPEPEPDPRDVRIAELEQLVAARDAELALERAGRAATEVDRDSYRTLLERSEHLAQQILKRPEGLSSP